jgi:DNA-binding transcriptional LysR family regulator
MEATLDRLESMSILVAAVETGSFSAASRQLGIPLANVSRKVADLEKHLRTRLLIRSSRRLSLTDAGQTYFVACKRILEDVDEAERAASGEYSVPKGNLIITAPIVLGRLHVLPIIVEFLATHPQINISMALTDRIVNLIEDRVDVAVRGGVLEDSSLIATRVGSVRRLVCGSLAYFAKRGTPTHPNDLCVHDCITFETLSSPEFWTFKQGKTNISAAIHSRLIVNTAEAAVDAAVAGVGITCVLSYQTGDSLRAGTLAIVLEEFEPAPTPVSLVYAGQGLLPRKARAFLDFIAPRLKARLLRDDA